MQNPKLRFVLGLVISVGLLVVLALWVALGDILTALRQANYIYVLPAIGLYFVAVYFRAARWQYLLSPLGRFPVRRLYPVVIIGYTANNLLPARVGEVVRAYDLARREPVSTSSALATVAVERVYDGVTLLALAAIAAPSLIFLGQFDGATSAYQATAIVLATAMIALFLGALLGLSLLATWGSFYSLLERIVSLLPRGLQPRVRQMVFTFVQGLGILNSWQKHLGVFLRSFPVWLFEGAMYLIISYSFGINDYFSSFWVLLLAITLLTATSNLITAVPAAIGGIGPFEVVAQQTLVGLGVASSAATGYALVLHLAALWLPVNLVGLALLWKQNLSLRRLAGGPQPTPSDSEFSGLSQAREEAT